MQREALPLLKAFSCTAHEIAVVLLRALLCAEVG